MSKSIGAYTVIQALVRDGEAYLAESADGRKCTIVVVDVAADDERLDRVRAETLACAALHHPTVAVIADVFDHDGKTAIVGPAPLEGVTLKALLDKLGSKKLNGDAVWYVALQIASAISLAHSTEVDGDFIPVCHGHLSPAFVELSYDGTVRVEGLGLGQLAGEKGLAADERYVAPEQRGGGRITPRGDIFSVAAILWQLLSGQKPKADMADSDVAASVPEGFVDAFGRALQEKVSKRHITSMELEQFIGEQVDTAPGAGKKALVAALAVFKKGRTLLGHAGTAAKIRAKKKGAPRLFEKGDAPPITRRGGTGKLGGALGRKKMPPMRSKQSTLGGMPASVDWDAASKSAESVSPPDIDDELSWGDEGDENLAGLVPTPSPADSHEIEDEDSDDEELTMMNPAGMELRAAMDEVKARRDSVVDEGVDTLKPPKSSGSGTDAQQEETTLVRSRKKLEREAKAQKKGGVPRSEDGEDITVMRARPKMPSKEEIAAAKAKRKDRISGPTSAPPRPRPSNRGLPRPSDPGARPPRPPDSKPSKPSKPGADKSDFMTTMASAGVTEGSSSSDSDVPQEPLKNLVLDIGTSDEPGTSEAPFGLDPELDSAVIPLQAPPDSKPDDDDDDDDEPIRVEREPVHVAVESAKPEPVQPEPIQPEPTPKPAASVEAQAPAASSSTQSSPWDKEAQTAEAEAVPKPIPKVAAAVIIIVTAVVVMVAGVLLMRRNATVGPPPSLPSGDATTAKKPTPAKKPTASAKPKPKAAPTASASVAPSGAVAPPEVDASALPATMGYLTVIFKADTDAIVSVFGKDIGKVGVPNQVLCTKTAFVRIKSTRGLWLNEGQPVVVKCKDTTTVEVKPKP